MGVASSRADARGLERAAAAGVETASSRSPTTPTATRATGLGGLARQLAVELVVLAGFMELLGPELIGASRGGS